MIEKREKKIHNGSFFLPTYLYMMRKLIKKILKEDDWGWADNIEPSEEIFYGAKENDKGWYWVIDNYPDWEDLYSGLESVRGLNPRWSIKPGLGGHTGERLFNQYLKTDGKFNVLLLWDRSDAYAWFDGQEYAYDKNDKATSKP